MTSYRDTRRILRQEIQAERRVSIETGSTSFTEIERLNEIPLDFPSFEMIKGVRKEVKVRGQDINDSALWKKFLKHSGRNDADLISLTSDLDPVAEEFDTFLDTHHTPRYRNLSFEGKQWRLRVVRLSVKYHIMENKLKGYREGADTFADDRVAYFYVMVRGIRDLITEFAIMVNHIVEGKEERRELLDAFFNSHYQKFLSTPFPQRDDILRLVDLDDREDM